MPLGCIAHLFLFWNDMWDPVGTGDLPAHPRASLQSTSKWLVCECVSHRQTNQSKAFTLSYLLCQALTMQVSFHASVIPRPGIRQLGIAPTPKSSLKSFKLIKANLKCVYPALLVAHNGNHSKGSCLHSPSTRFIFWLILILPPQCDEFPSIGNYE